MSDLSHKGTFLDMLESNHNLLKLLEERIRRVEKRLDFFTDAEGQHPEIIKRTHIIREIIDLLSNL